MNTTVSPTQPAKSIADITLAAVCPMANEAATAVEFVQRLLQALACCKDSKLFIVLDHASRDNTKELLQDYAKQEPRLAVIWAPDNQNVVDAYFCGYRTVTSNPHWDYILEIDAGFSHLPEEFPAFIPHIEHNRPCIFGSRFTTHAAYQQGDSRKRISRLGTYLTKLFIGSKQTDLTSGYQIFRRDILQAVVEQGVLSQAHFFQTEIKLMCRQFEWVEVPITYTPTADQVSRKAILNSLMVLAKLFVLKLQNRMPTLKLSRNSA